MTSSNIRSRPGLLTALVLSVAGMGHAQTVDVPDGQVTGERLDTAVAALDAMVTDLMTDTGVPGLAVAVVHDGQTIFEKGYGLRELGKTDPIDTQTVFQLASLSKSVSGTIVARQVSQKSVAWTTPIHDLLPDVRLSDPWVTEHVTIGDLFAHRSGLPDHAGDDIEDIGFNRAEVLDRLQYLPLSPFRATYAYTNFGLTLAADAVAEAAGTDWATLAEEALYIPLGMNNTSSRFADFRDHPNRATGHTLRGGQFVPYEFRDPDAQSPAGGVSSTIEDFAVWMKMVLAEGNVGTPPLIDSAALLPAISAEVISRPSPTPADPPSFYGYGFVVGIGPSGQVVLSHSGAFLLGAGTTYRMLPSANLGIAVFSNATPIGVPEIIAAQFMDLAQYGDYQRDWRTLYTEGMKFLVEPVGALAGQLPPENPQPAAPLTQYAGTYQNDYVGTVSIAVDGDGLVMNLGPTADQLTLTHWDADQFTFTLITENLPEGSIPTVTFSSPENGAAPSLVIEHLNEHGMGELTRAG